VQRPLAPGRQLAIQRLLRERMVGCPRPPATTSAVASIRASSSSRATSAPVGSAPRKPPVGRAWPGRASGSSACAAPYGTGNVRMGAREASRGRAAASKTAASWGDSSRAATSRRTVSRYGARRPPFQVADGAPAQVCPLGQLLLREAGHYPVAPEHLAKGEILTRGEVFSVHVSPVEADTAQ